MSDEERLAIAVSNDLNAQNCSLSYIFKYFHPGVDERHIRDRIISRVNGNESDPLEGRDVIVLMNLLIYEGLVSQSCSEDHAAYTGLIRHVIQAVSIAFDLECATGGEKKYRCSANGGLNKLGFAEYSRRKRTQYEHEMIKKKKDMSYKLNLGDGQFGVCMKEGGIDFVSILKAVTDRELRNMEVDSRLLSIKKRNVYTTPVIGERFSFNHEGTGDVYTEMNSTGEEVAIKLLCEGDTPGSTETVTIRSRMTLHPGFEEAIASRSASMFGELSGHIMRWDRTTRPRTEAWFLERLKHIKSVSMSTEDEDEIICEIAHACVDRYHPSNHNVMIYFYGSFSGVMHHVCEALTISLLRVVKTYKDKGKEKRMSFNSGGGFKHIFQLTEKLYSLFAIEPDFDWIFSARRKNGVNIMDDMIADNEIALRNFVEELANGFSDNKPENGAWEPIENIDNEKARVSQLIIRFDVLWRIMGAMLQIPRLRRIYKEDDSIARTHDYARAKSIVDEYDPGTGLVDIVFLKNRINVYEAAALEELYTLSESDVSGAYFQRVTNIFASFLEYDAGIAPD